MARPTIAELQKENQKLQAELQTIKNAAKSLLDFANDEGKLHNICDDGIASVKKLGNLCGFNMRYRVLLECYIDDKITEDHIYELSSEEFGKYDLKIYDITLHST